MRNWKDASHFKNRPQKAISFKFLPELFQIQKISFPAAFWFQNRAKILIFAQVLLLSRIKSGQDYWKLSIYFTW